MGLVWHLESLLAERNPEVLANLPFALPHGDEAPGALTLAQLAEICRVLACQPGDLLSYAFDTPAEQAARQLANDLFYQSFLAYQDDEAPHDA
ncbi:MAG TPA: helix-turn-helix domain-containing protein [Oscillatoriaceae cyanobacterium]